MPWTYEQSTGALIRDGVHRAGGYAGFGRGCNNPAYQDQPNEGPLPQGRYTIGAPIQHPTCGPFCMPLTPAEGNEMFKRHSFHIHGDNRAGNRSASHGCIVLTRSAREMIWQSGDHQLDVIAGPPTHDD